MVEQMGQWNLKLVLGFAWERLLHLDTDHVYGHAFEPPFFVWVESHKSALGETADTQLLNYPIWEIVSPFRPALSVLHVFCASTDPIRFVFVFHIAHVHFYRLLFRHLTIWEKPRLYLHRLTQTIAPPALYIYGKPHSSNALNQIARGALKNRWNLDILMSLLFFRSIIHTCMCHPRFVWRLSARCQLQFYN